MELREEVAQVWQLFASIAFSTNICVERAGTFVIDRRDSSEFFGTNMGYTEPHGRAMEIESRNACPKSEACRSSLRNTRNLRSPVGKATSGLVDH